MLLSGLFAFNSKNYKAGDTQDLTTPFNEWKPIPLPDSFSFAGERVALERQDVREQFDRELLMISSLPNNLLYIFKLSGRLFPLIEERLRANGVPDDFKYVCVAESNLQNLTSRSGAVGYWQFMPGTAPLYKLEVNGEVDERYDIIKSTDAACRYFREAYAKAGSWTAAAAAYNCGIGRYNNSSFVQNTNQYYDLMLPDETNRYVFRVLVFKYLMQQADKLGFIVKEDEKYLPLSRKILVTSTIPDLPAFARKHGINYRALRLYNPWLRANRLTVKTNKSYELFLP